uniref:Pentatricopeptide repeat-containing protein At3g09040, mitochondrial n=1 Tax=Anthurium amnicola TaxID=1678845 RepID=A0A1D1Z7A7_9ARAE
MLAPRRIWRQGCPRPTNLPGQHIHLPFSPPPQGPSPIGVKPPPSVIDAADPEAYADLLLSWSKWLCRKNLGLSRNLLDETPHRTLAAAESCRILHARIARLGFRLVGRLATALVDLYSKSRGLVYARRVFDGVEGHDGAAWNAVLSVYSRQGMPGDVVREFRSMRQAGLFSNEHSFAIVLSSCARLEDLDCGRQIHGDIIKTGFGFSAFCQGSLLNMYAKCGRVDDARQLFDGYQNPDTISWTAMMGGYVQAGMPGMALKLFDRMREQGVVLDGVTSVTAITACVGLGRLQDARDLFVRMTSPNTIAWNAIISGHSQNGHEADALGFFQEMHSTGVKPTRSTLGSVLSAAAVLNALDEGRQVHSEAVRLGLDSNVYVGSSLISMYAKCCAIEDAKKVFNLICEKNLVMWNAMLGGYIQNGQPEEVMELFFEMNGSGFPCDEFTCVSLFGACACLEDLELGRQLHCAVIKRNYDRSIFVGNAVVDMYSKSGELDSAKQQFELIPDPDIVSWNALIVGHVYNERESEALCMFCSMREDNVLPDVVSFATVISACSSVQRFEVGKQVHCLATKFGLQQNIYVGSSLVDFYAKLGDMESSRKVFVHMPEKSVVSTNALITGYVQNNNMEEALVSFRQMLRQGLKPSQFTFASVLPACVGPFGPRLGMQLHCHTLKSGFLHSDVVVHVALMNLYLKSRSQEDAYNLFSEVCSNKNVILWTAIISGHAQNGYCEDAISLFWKMHGYNVRPDQSTFASVLGACAYLASSKDGKVVHSLIVRTGFDSDEHTGSALVDMYSKCGDICASLRVFNEMKNKKGIISWNSLIVGLAKNGFAEEALAFFHQMQELNILPDDITILGVLTACSHAGLVSEGRAIFDSMHKYGINPRTDHHACVVDLLGRGGYLKEAEEFINELPYEPDAVIWSTFLSACRMHGDNERSTRAAENLIKLEPRISSSYVLLSNICAVSGNWDGVRTTRRAMKERGVKKTPGCSWITVGNKTSSFVAGDKFHPDSVDIYAILKHLTAVMKKDGYDSELGSLSLH